MLTRETALARLRTTGTLASFARPLTAITSADARDPTAQQVSRIMVATLAGRHGRHLAPGSNHLVLP